MSNGSVTVNTKGMDALQAHLRAGTYARVGVVGDTAARTGESYAMTNAEIGLINEVGSMENNIPARSWLRVPMWLKEKEIAAFVKSPAIMKMLLGGKVTEALKLIGIFGESIIKEAFNTRGFGQWEPNAPSTIARKGSSAPLIDTSQLRRAVTSDVVQS
jgi:hypothetical protein